MSQRLLRAKQKIARAAIPYGVPRTADLPQRLKSVLAVVYLVFTQGYAAADNVLTGEAVRLGRLLFELLPDHDEVRCLLALMLLQHSRRDATVVDGQRLTLSEQDRTGWDHMMIDEADVLLAETAGERGSYRVQAEMASVHATAPDAAATDWSRLIGLYDELLVLQPSPVVALNRAVAVAEVDGPLAGLTELAELSAWPDARRLDGYGPAHAVRGELLARAGRPVAAREAFARAAELAATDAQRRQIDRRVAGLLS